MSTTTFYLLTRAGVTPPGGGPERTHAVLEGADAPVCNQAAPNGWGGVSIPQPTTDWSQVTCPTCLSGVTQTFRAAAVTAPATGPAQVQGVSPNLRTTAAIR